MSLSRFNDVESALKTRIESVVGSGKVFIGQYSAPDVFPRATMFIESITAEDRKISMRKLLHFWRWRIELENVSGNPAEGYAKMKQLYWDIYDAVMADRSLGFAGVLATPSEGMLEAGVTPEGRYGFRWSIYIVARVEDV